MAVLSTAALVFAGAEFFYFGGRNKMKKHIELRMISEGAIFVALATVLSLLKLWEMPWGGSIELAMIPMVSIYWGIYVQM